MIPFKGQKDNASMKSHILLTIIAVVRYDKINKMKLLKHFHRLFAAIETAAKQPK